jgi:hypothetical protein
VGGNMNNGGWVAGLLVVLAGWAAGLAAQEPAWRAVDEPTAPPEAAGLPAGRWPAGPSVSLERPVVLRPEPAGPAAPPAC